MYKITEEQKKVIEKGLLTAIDNGTDDEFTSQEMHLINDAFELVNNLTIPVVIEPFYCNSDDGPTSGRCKEQCFLCRPLE